MMLGLILANGQNTGRRWSGSEMTLFLRFILMVKHIKNIGLVCNGIWHLRLIRDLRPDINIIAVRSGKGEYIQSHKIDEKIALA